MSSTHQTEFDMAADRSVGVAVARAVAAVDGVTPESLAPPLGEHVDLDALDALVRDARTGPGLEVSFRYRGHRVTVTGDGTVRLGDD